MSKHNIITAITRMSPPATVPETMAATESDGTSEPLLYIMVAGSSVPTVSMFMSSSAGAVLVGAADIVTAELGSESDTGPKEKNNTHYTHHHNYISICVRVCVRVCVRYGRSPEVHQPPAK